jgi:hypothetical protein
MEEISFRRDFHDPLNFTRCEEITQDPVVRGNVVSMNPLGQEGLPLASHTRIDHYHMNGPPGKIPIRTVEEKGSFQDILRGYPMAQIDDFYPRVNPKDYPFHDPDEGIGTPEIGQKSDDLQLLTFTRSPDASATMAPPEVAA